MNKDEAQRCMDIGVNAYREQNYVKAKTYLTKSQTLYTTPEAQEWLNRIKLEEEQADPEVPLPSEEMEEPANNIPLPQEEEKPKTNTNSYLPEFSLRSFSRWTQTLGESSTSSDVAVRRILTCSSHYEVLGIEKTASPSDIKRAYFNYARELHPDKNTAKGADEAFKLLLDAYNVLKDVNLRADYDRALADGRGAINTSVLKQTSRVKLTKEEHGVFNYYAKEVFLRQFVQEFVIEKLLSPTTWPWARPEFFLKPTIDGARYMLRFVHLNFAAAAFVCGMAQLFAIWMIWNLSYTYSYLTYTIYATLILFILPYFYFLKNRVLVYWKYLLGGYIFVWIIWHYILGPYLYTIGILYLFAKSFSLAALLSAHKKTLIAGLVVLYFVCDSVFFQILRPILFVLSVFRIFVILLTEQNNVFDAGESHSHAHGGANPFANFNAGGGHQHSHSNGARCSHSHSQPHAHSHSQPLQDQFYNTEDGGQLRFTTNGRIFYKSSSNVVSDVTDEFLARKKAWEESQKTQQESPQTPNLRTSSARVRPHRR